MAKQELEKKSVSEEIAEQQLSEESVKQMEETAKQMGLQMTEQFQKDLVKLMMKYEFTVYADEGKAHKFIKKSLSENEKERIDQKQQELWPLMDKRDNIQQKLDKLKPEDKDYNKTLEELEKVTEEVTKRTNEINRLVLRSFLRYENRSLIPDDLWKSIDEGTLFMLSAACMMKTQKIPETRSF